MLFPLIFSLYYQDAGILPLLQSMGLILVAGIPMVALCRPRGTLSLSHREGIAIVALGWFFAGVAGCLPFYIGGVCGSFTDSCFESFSGFTTTGASVLTNIEVVSKGLLMWRSFTHWLGGMGIIVLSLAILPFLGVGGMQLYKAEVPGPVPDKLKPRIRDTAMVLWKVYLGFTIAQALLLLLGGMDLFDSLCHTFGTMATGGFSTRNASVAAYPSPYIQWVIIIFMFAAGANFALHYRLLRGKPLALWRDSEFRFYALVVILATAVSAWALSEQYGGLEETIRVSAFQVVSIVTTTGFATADYELWPALCQSVLVILMFLGGCAGSTGGGVKCMRALLLFKQSGQEMTRLIHPRAVTHVKLGGKSVPPEIMSGIWGFFILYLGLFLLSSLFLAAMGIDLATSFSSVIACIGNIGPGFGSVGPVENYAHLPALAKWILIFDMVLGRLEIYTVILLFVPEFWRK